MISTEAFQSHHVPEAARLFAAQYARLRNDNELLPAQFAEAAVLEPRLLGILREHPGVVALEGDCVVGYLVGFTGIPQFKGLANGGYVPVWGWGLAESQEVETVFPALYAELSAEWMRRNCPSMAVSYLLPGGALQKTLFGLGFGQLLYDGMRSLSRIALLADGDIEVREAEEGDLAELAALERGLGRHMRSAPIFLHFDETRPEAMPQEFLGEGVGAFIARQDGRAIAALRGRLNMGPGCDLFDVAGSLGIDFAFTDPAARKRGVATRLLNELLAWGAAQGMTRCVVDFESANLLAKRFWLRHFRPVCHAVMRRVDERV